MLYSAESRLSGGPDWSPDSSDPVSRISVERPGQEYYTIRWLRRHYRQYVSSKLFKDSFALT